MLFNLAFDNALYLFLSQVQAWGVRRAIAGEGEGWRVVCGLSTPGETSPTVFLLSQHATVLRRFGTRQTRQTPCTRRRLSRR